MTWQITSSMPRSIGPSGKNINKRHAPGHIYAEMTLHFLPSLGYSNPKPPTATGPTFRATKKPGSQKGSKSQKIKSLKADKLSGTEQLIQALVSATRSQKPAFQDDAYFRGFFTRASGLVVDFSPLHKVVFRPKTISTIKNFRKQLFEV